MQKPADFTPPRFLAISKCENGSLGKSIGVFLFFKMMYFRIVGNLLYLYDF